MAQDDIGSRGQYHAVDVKERDHGIGEDQSLPADDGDIEGQVEEPQNSDCVGGQEWGEGHEIGQTTATQEGHLWREQGNQDQGSRPQGPAVAGGEDKAGTDEVDEEGKEGKEEGTPARLRVTGGRREDKDTDLDGQPGRQFKVAEAVDQGTGYGQRGEGIGPDASRPTWPAEKAPGDGGQAGEANPKLKPGAEAPGMRAP